MGDGYQPGRRLAKAAAEELGDTHSVTSGQVKDRRESSSIASAARHESG
jgi:hypothetical protein